MARIQRREVIAELEQQLTILQVLIDRQASVSITVSDIREATD